MDRRAAITLMAKSMGLAIAFPTIVSTLSACQDNAGKENNTAKYNLKYLTSRQYHLVSGLVDVILPETDIIGAAKLNIAQFIDLILANTMKVKEQVEFSIGATLFEVQIKEQFNVSAVTASVEHYHQLLSSFFSLSEQDQQQIFSQQKLPAHEIEKTEIDNYYLYKFLLTTRELTLLGYYTSEFVGENILNYDPVPENYQPCIDVAEVGNSWAS